MTLPGYRAETSLYMTSRYYRITYSQLANDTAPMLIAQQDPCALPGDVKGGGQFRPSRCRSGTKCCGHTMNGLCYGQCVPNNFQCP
jgi:hypothetical protein